MLASKHDENFELRLYVTGTTALCARAISNIEKICVERLAGRYTLQVIDIYEEPQLAEADHIMAIPTLIKINPPPVRRLIGDLSNTEHVLLGLGL